MSDVGIVGVSGGARAPFASVEGARLRQLMTEQEAPLQRHLARLGLRSAEIEDALQEVLIVVARKLGQVQHGSERAFLFATAARIARNARRGAARRERTAASLCESATQVGPRVDDLAQEMNGVALLDDALDQLPEEVRVVFLLAELEEMTVPVVAERLGLAHGTVSSRLRRARAHFQTWCRHVREATDSDEAVVPRPRRSASVVEPEILSWWVQRGEADALRALIDVFERVHPRQRSISSATVRGNALARAELSSRMLRGEPPDTFQVNGGNALRSWVRRTPWGEQMEPIDFLFLSEGWHTVLPPDVLDLVSHRGRLYAVPLDIHRTNLLFYNPRVFSDNGLRPPTTLDDFHSIAEIFRARGVVPLALGFRDPWTLTMLTFEAVLIGEAGPEYYRAFCDGRRSADDVELQHALAHVTRMLGYANEDAATLGWNGALDLVSSGGAAMTIAGDWGKGYLLSKGCRLGVEFGVAPSLGRSKAFVFATDVFGLPKRAGHRAEAIELLKVFGSKAGQAAFNSLKGAIPARVDVDVSSFDAIARSNASDFRSAPRVPSLVSIVPTGFSRALDRALSAFATDHDAGQVLSAIRANYDLLRR